MIIEAPELCPRFAARVFDVRVGPSPAWLKDRLELAGQRSINNIVDLSNYVMLEMGQPTHAFDLTKLRGGVLKARMAGAGEVVKTLDDVERTLSATMGVVADAEGALAIAGIMGGASSEISGRDQHGGARSRVLEPAPHPPRGESARHAHRRVAPVRARRRPCGRPHLDRPVREPRGQGRDGNGASGSDPGPGSRDQANGGSP